MVRSSLLCGYVRGSLSLSLSPELSLLLVVAERRAPRKACESKKAKVLVASDETGGASAAAI